MSRYAPSAMSRRNSEVPLLCGSKRKASSRLGETSKEYCQNTSLHGFQYLGKKDSHTTSALGEPQK